MRPVIYQTSTFFYAPAARISAKIPSAFAQASAMGRKRRFDVNLRIHALDNFGTGYSSLYHLRNFKLDKIEIDRSFIHAMASERESAGIVSAPVGLGHGLGLTIAADSIDASDQEESLILRGCEQGQGSLFDAPMTANETEWLISDPRENLVG